MKEAIVKTGTQVEIIDSPIPKAEAGQVVIKVIVTGSNPKDWKVPDWEPKTGQINQGDDVAGTIHEIGEGVTGFKVGDRVAAFHEMGKPHGSFAEYASSWAYTTFHIPDSVSYEEAAAVPLAAMTAAIGLFHHDELDLPPPWQSTKTSKTKTPLVVYGGASAVGSYIIQLASRAGIHPIIAIAGRGKDHVERLIDQSKGDAYVDYRNGDDAVVSGVKEAVKKTGVDQILYAFDAVSTPETKQNLYKILDKGGRMTVLLPDKEKAPDSIYNNLTYVGAVHAAQSKIDDDKDFGYIYFKYIARGLEDGWFKGHNPEVVPGGLAGLEGALRKLKDGKASAVKFVFRIADTPGVGS